MPSAEELLSQYYNNDGWDEKDGITQDAIKDEDLRNCAKEYISKCRLRVLKYIPLKGENFLDLGSGPIQYPEYLAYSKNFKKRFCLDLSHKALEVAKSKLGEHGEYLHGSFFNIELPKESFDCAITLHCIYHMDFNNQDTAIRKLLSLLKPGMPLIVVYSNPYSFEQLIFKPIKNILKIFFILFDEINFLIFKKRKYRKTKFYFKPHSLFWWNRFSDESIVKINPWRTFSARMQKIAFPNNYIGRKMFKILFNLEEKFPKFFVFFGTYPIITLIKK